MRGTDAAAAALLTPLQVETGETCLVRMLTDNPIAEAMIANLPEVVHEMRGRIALEALEAAGDPVLRDLLTALDAASLRHPLPGGELSFLSTIAHFGTSEDVTIRDLRLELLFPADAATRAALKAMAG